MKGASFVCRRCGFFLYVLFVTFPVACWCAKLCEVEVFLFSVLQFTEQRLLSVFSTEDEAAHGENSPLWSRQRRLTFCPYTHTHTHTHNTGRTRAHSISIHRWTTRLAMRNRLCSACLRNSTHYAHMAQDSLSHQQNILVHISLSKSQCSKSM